MRLSELKAVHLAVCFWLFHAQAFHEPAVLLCRKLTGFFAVSWPLIYAALQTLIQKDKPYPSRYEPIRSACIGRAVYRTVRTVRCEDGG